MYMYNHEYIYIMQLCHFQLNIVFSTSTLIMMALLQNISCNNIFIIIIQIITNTTQQNTQKLLEKIDDASTELMMGTGDKVMLRLGEAMFEATEDEATEFCEAEVERHQETLDKFGEEETDILERQGELKKILYGRFGKSINLEDK